MPAYKGDWDGFRQAGYSLGTATGASLFGKILVDAERPDKSGNDSFPSSHTAISFAAATTLNLRYGWEVGLPAYGVATLVGVGRVQADKHYWSDVLAGAMLGSLAGWVFTDSPAAQVQVLPWTNRHETGVFVTSRW